MKTIYAIKRFGWSGVHASSQQGGMRTGGNSTPSAEEQAADEEAGIQELIDAMTATQVRPAESVEAAQEMALWNLNMLGDVTDAAADRTFQVAERMDEYSRERFYSSLESVVPDWRQRFITQPSEDIDAIRGISQSLLRGEIPDDVREKILDANTEFGIRGGVFAGVQGSEKAGTILDYRAARNIGKTSLEMQAMGIDYTLNAVSPLTARLLQQSQAVQPQYVDPAALYGAHLSAATGGAVVSPTAVLQTSAQQNMFNAEMAWNTQLSRLNASMDMYSTNLQNQYNQDALSVQRRGQTLNFISGLIGGAGSFL